MSIHTKKSGTVTEIAPRLKRNGAIVTPFSGWAKKDGVLVKVWDKYALEPIDFIVSEEAALGSYGATSWNGAKVTLDLTSHLIPRKADGTIVLTTALSTGASAMIATADVETLGESSLTIEAGQEAATVYLLPVYGTSGSYNVNFTVSANGITIAATTKGYYVRCASGGGQN